MATFYSLLNFMAVNGFEYSDPRSFDIINSLPLEMAITVLRMLSGKDLLNAACVDKRWFHICKSDSKLRQKIRRYVRQQRRAAITARLLGTSRRNVTIDVPDRPAMINVVNTSNTTNLQANRFSVEASTSRYMPYRRETKISTGSSSRRRNMNIEKNTSSRSRLRM